MAEFASMTMKDLKGYLSEGQVASLIDSASNLRDRLILQVMYRCGRRVSEVLMMTKDDILWDEDKIIFNILKRKKPVKEMKPVDGETMALLRQYVESPDISGLRKRMDGDLLFPVSRQYVFKLIRKLGKQVGIEYVGKKRLHCHHLRHSFAVHQVRTNVKTAEDLRKLQMYMAHANISTTSHYLQFSPDELRSLVSHWEKKKDDKDDKQ
jgi:integrase/recombinase XerD